MAITGTGHPRRDHPQPPLATILNRLLQSRAIAIQRREVESPPSNRATKIGDVPSKFGARNDCCDGRGSRPSPPSVPAPSTVSGSNDGTIGAVKPSTAPTLRTPIAGSFHVGNDQPDGLGRCFDEYVLTNHVHISILTASPQKVDSSPCHHPSSAAPSPLDRQRCGAESMRAVRQVRGDAVRAGVLHDLHHISVD